MVIVSKHQNDSFKTADISQDQRPLWLFFRSIATGAPGFRGADETAG